jgi:phosphoribosyl 1,2-cyclic phosphate phosphodiesterase
LKLTFLGTGTSTGIPVIGCNCPVCLSNDTKDKRLRTSLMISYNDKNIVIDTGPDFRQQMLLNNISDIDAIVYTHAHKDHIAGLDDIRAINYIQNKYIDIFAENIVVEALEREYPYIFKKDYPGVPLVKIHKIDECIFEIYQQRWTPIRAMHKDLPILGFRIDDFVYITDANQIEDKELEKCMRAKIFVINAVQLKPHYSHFNLEEALQIIEKVAPQKAYITHASHRLGIHQEISKILPPNVALAYDGMMLEL